MKGIIFTGFLNMVETNYSEDLVETIIAASKIPNNGAYTEIGTYDYQELLRLLKNLSHETGKTISEIEIIYGRYLFNKFLTRYKSLIVKCKNTFDFLVQVDGHIHVEVRKLYPDAELPKFICELKKPNYMIMEYRSNHPFEDLAEGLIIGCAEHFNEKISIERISIEPKKEMLNEVLFFLTRQE